MKTWFLNSAARPHRRLGLFGMVLALIVLLGIASTQQVSADGGGFASPTPTNTLTPTATLTPIPSLTPLPTQIIVPTLTPTVIGQIVTETVPLVVVPETPETPGTGAGLPLVCWPFALGFILLVIIVGIVLIGGQSAYP